ncbi:MAG: hypothetical protein GTO45_37745 [Candidatus Aminicenantes bacterium]|nr:hypothetical protein [Candidatus Aminicenantes bacterium]NIM84409.1 hypothetical protein [Candidatus Aminicenantes bacterium]NIN18523.1 hypothetical protein [Candidatus Aminicenantes bacterium]NIN42419.1 hypothetical protein [Candidatus Aminicenantes bacterium]NIN90533.1 hypothetical protein [Candidatus Aminicenantes bacterium]
MSNGKIFYNNLITNSTLSVSSEAEGFEKEYLVNKNQGVVWRSTGINENIIQMSFDSTTAIKGMVVLNHNLESGDTFYLEASADNFPTTAQSQAVDPGKGFIEVNWNYQYYRLRLQKTSGDYIQVGEIYLIGSSYEFDRNFKWNYSYTREINRNSKQTTSGQVYRKTRFIRKGFDLEFDGMTDTQKENFESISESDYICFLPNGSSGDLYYGIVDFSTYTHVYTNYWNASVNFMENPK